MSVFWGELCADNQRSIPPREREQLEPEFARPGEGFKYFCTAGRAPAASLFREVLLTRVGH